MTVLALLALVVAILPITVAIGWRALLWLWLQLSDRRRIWLRRVVRQFDDRLVLVGAVASASAITYRTGTGTPWGTHILHATGADPLGIMLAASAALTALLVFSAERHLSAGQRENLPTYLGIKIPAFIARQSLTTRASPTAHERGHP